jgi:hypothetical protein
MKLTFILDFSGTSFPYLRAARGLKNRQKQAIYGLQLGDMSTRIVHVTVHVNGKIIHRQFTDVKN